MRILITGVSSGLGKSLSNELREHRLQLWDRENFGLSVIPVDVVIHCAHDRTTPEANFEMLYKLRHVPHTRFVYISSIDVWGFASEYVAVKRECDALVRAHFDNPLIVRPSLMLGRQMRPNTISRMLLGEPLSLSPESTISCVSYGTVMRGIMQGLDDRYGALTIGYGPMRLDDMAAALGLEPIYGDFTYKAHMPPDHSNCYTLQTVQDFRDLDFGAWREAHV